jgi:hypothetical protein
MRRRRRLPRRVREHCPIAMASAAVARHVIGCHGNEGFNRLSRYCSPRHILFDEARMSARLRFEYTCYDEAGSICLSLPHAQLRHAGSARTRWFQPMTSFLTAAPVFSMSVTSRQEKEGAAPRTVASQLREAMRRCCHRNRRFHPHHEPLGPHPRRRRRPRSS